MRVCRGLALLALALGSPLAVGYGCYGTKPAPSPVLHWTSPGGTVSVAVTEEPFSFVLTGATGQVLLESTRPHTAADAAVATGAYGPLALTHDTDTSVPGLIVGWSYFRGTDAPWQLATRVTSSSLDAGGLTVHVATKDPVHPAMTVTFAAPSPDPGLGVHIVASVDAPGEPTGDTYANRVSLGFALHDDDHFLGFGERFVRADHRGQMLYTWVEEGGFAQGEDVAPGPDNPTPNGEEMTYMPIPWFLSPRGFGMLVNGSTRTNYHLGDEVADAWRVEATGPSLDVTILADPDPLVLLQALTDITGRPPEVADWVLAPRRRGDVGSDEMEKLRAAHIPTSVIDTAMHYFPDGPPTNLTAPGAMQAVTSDIHSRGFKAVAYFNSFIADTWHPAFDEAVANGYLVKHADGTPYTVLDVPYNAGIVDFTNPAAVAWYQGFLQQALDDGWDGWMYDFGEYIAEDAVMWNGMSGMQAHNLYPVLFQKAASELLERERKGDYLIFVRSGYAGTSGLVPMVWGGDESTDFDTAKGLPAALLAGLNDGMSGIPLWGSDISGYDYVFNPPPDKELYLRWTELGAFSADMHDENQGTGNEPVSARWQILDDQESQDVYRTYASMKTRMLPYVRIAVREARARGTPVMRHLFLLYPRDPTVLTITDEYMYGDDLLVAPVVTRGATSRSVYLPDPQYFDFWTGARVLGARTVTADASLDFVPVYARVGAIVPLLAPDVETVVPSADGGAVSMQDRAGYLEVQVFAGGSSQAVLDDGTTFTQTAPATPFDLAVATHTSAGTPTVIPAATSAADLMSCAACTWAAKGSHVWSVAVVAQDDQIDAGPLRLTLVGSPNVKRFVFTVRH